MEQPGRLANISDENQLAQLGYRQELKRNWTFLHNFGVSFSVISVITGITTLFEYGLTTGGPGVMSSGWILDSFFTLFIALSMAEIVSSIPTSGGPYFWAARLAPADNSAFAAWMTGWFNLLGQIAVTSGITFGGAQLISVTATIGSSYNPSPEKTIGIFGGLLISHAIINSFAIEALRYLNRVSVILHSVGVTCFAIAILTKAPTHQSAKFVFATFYDGTGTDGNIGWSLRASPAYVAVCGILMSQYTITGFDASAHLSEETHHATWNAPLGVLTSVVLSGVFGFFLLICLLFCIQDFQATVNSNIGQPVIQILLDIFGLHGAVALMVLVIVCVWHCGLFSMTSNSRMMFGFARDGGIPKPFNAVNARFSTPVRTIWLAASLSFFLAVPSLGSSAAFTAATSIATIGLYASYGIPILLGLAYPQNFKKGLFNLGRGSPLVACVALCWICFTTIVLCLPQMNPVNGQTLNYASVAVGIVFLGALGSWVFWARKWFKGPMGTMEMEMATADIVEPEVSEKS